MIGSLDDQRGFLHVGMRDESCADETFVPFLEVAAFMPNRSRAVNPHKPSTAADIALQGTVLFVAEDSFVRAAVVVEDNNVVASQPV